MKVTVRNRFDTEMYAKEKHDTASVIISINSVYENYANIEITNDNNIRDILFLKLDDTDMESPLAINKLDALKIKAFITKHKDIPEIIVHCGAGQSRSAGVAAAILKYMYNDDTQIFNNKRYTPNMRCYRLVLETLMEKEMNFYEAWTFLNEHFIFNGFFSDCLDIDVVKVNPKTGDWEEDDETLNTQTEVWLECGPWDKDVKTHNEDLDCGGKTFEEAIVNLAYLVKEQYGE